MSRWIVSGALLSAPVHAETLPGRAVNGVQVGIDPTGELNVRVIGSVLLDDGRVLSFREGKWTSLPNEVQDIKTFSAIDFAVYGRDYVGKRVRVVGGTIVDAEVSGGQLILKGARATVKFDQMPRESVKLLIENCESLFRNTLPVCNAPIVGTVKKQELGETLVLIDAIVEASSGPTIRSR